MLNLLIGYFGLILIMIIALAIAELFKNKKFSLFPALTQKEKKFFAQWNLITILIFVIIYIICTIFKVEIDYPIVLNAITCSIAFLSLLTINYD